MDYSYIAPYYQFLSRLVFGNHLIRAQYFALTLAKTTDKILILGVGDGKFLENLTIEQEFPRIVLIDQSREMLEICKKRKLPQNTEIYCLDILRDDLPKGFDVIILPFILDNFNDNEVALLIRKLVDNHNNPNIIVVDYTENPKTWQKILLRSMYFFFRIVAKLKVTKLPNIDTILRKKGLCKVKQSFFCHNFIHCSVYRKRKVTRKL
ncbi:Uncharacterised protein [Weeksella virosa]|uniref:class I SAM-dependent methyltransferase n=1 Tax=Weeksella virosa TaxID=1014 RepID=UPI000E05FECC|nr:class I SAM-dependent methyltransferase [Weeksella virosa]SUP55020.1 Uncharacterised protein [Weeksella virosa]